MALAEIAYSDLAYFCCSTVPAKIGNGDDPHNNLYWGAAYGVKTFLSKADGWRNLGCEKDISDTILERCEFA
jgi:hypothetical protein